MPQNDLRLPPEVLDSIRAHIERAVKHAEAGYSSAQEAEDSVTGELGGALRTDEDQLVSVSRDNRTGMWRWSISYSKFGSGARDATESIVGADGILEVRVGAAEMDRRKSALFQAKNTVKKDRRLLAQVVKMSVWREASFVIIYSKSGYKTYSLDDILRASGSVIQAKNGVPLANWIVDVFLGCRVGHTELYYDKNERRLYWTRTPLSESERPRDQEVWVDFSPKHIIHIDVIPPNWQWSGAKEIPPEKIALSRLAYTARELFGIEGAFTLQELKKRRTELLHAYHPDMSHQLGSELSPFLNARAREIYDAYDELSALATQSAKPAKTQKRSRTKPQGLGEAPGTPVGDFTKKKAKRVKVRRK